MWHYCKFWALTRPSSSSGQHLSPVSVALCVLEYLYSPGWDATCCLSQGYPYSLAYNSPVLIWVERGTVGGNCLHKNTIMPSTRAQPRLINLEWSALNMGRYTSLAGSGIFVECFGKTHNEKPLNQN